MHILVVIIRDIDHYIIIIPGIYVFLSDNLWTSNFMRDTCINVKIGKKHVISSKDPINVGKYHVI